MKTVTVNLPRELKYIDVHILSDWHLGDSDCKINEIRDTVKAIKDNPNAYVLINGDILNNATKTSISDIYSANMTPMEQIDLAYKILEPIKDRILAMTSGNHEDRTYKQDGIDLMAFLATKLNILDKYDPIATRIFLRLGEFGSHKGYRQICYKIYMTHGSGGGKKIGSKVQRIVDLRDVINADIYVHSHTHEGAVVRGVRQIMDERTNSVREEKMLFINSAASLSYGGYGEKLGFSPAYTKSPVIHLSGEEKEFEATY